MKNLLRAVFLITFIGIGYSLNAQNVGVNSTSNLPDNSAQLDLSSSDKGVLIPRVALVSTNSAAPMINPATSLLVYNTSVSGSGNTQVFPGFYYWSGTSWLKTFAPRVLAGRVNVGDVNGTVSTPTTEGYFTSAVRSNCNSAICITVNFPGLPTSNYTVNATHCMKTGTTINTPGTNSLVEMSNDVDPIFVYDKTNSSFRVYIEETAANVQDIAIDFLIVLY